jgi:hypothetical protein
VDGQAPPPLETAAGLREIVVPKHQNRPGRSKWIDVLQVHRNSADSPSSRCGATALSVARKGHVVLTRSVGIPFRPFWCGCYSTATRPGEH